MHGQKQVCSQHRQPQQENLSDGRWVAVKLSRLGRLTHEGRWNTFKELMPPYLKQIGRNASLLFQGALEAEAHSEPN